MVSSDHQCKRLCRNVSARRRLPLQVRKGGHRMSPRQLSNKCKLIKVGPHRYGEGKVHLAVNRGVKYSPYWLAYCTTSPLHGELVDGTHDEVTCKKCLAPPPVRRR